MTRDRGPRRLHLRRESLRQLTPADLTAVAGGRGPSPRTYQCTRSGGVFEPAQDEGDS
ncbi:MAG TPA: hypothetical protein VMZ28_00545 [Kofleriaceae bacterium]|nr:hypothetical protein [Kofleriaceae bacterium]